MKITQLSVIGAGMMGGAIVEGVLRSGLVSPDQISIFDVDTARMDSLRQKTGVRCADSIADCVQSATVILLAIKPQYLIPVLCEMRDHFSPDALVISVAAGVMLDVYKYRLGFSKIVRVMPNTPAKIGEGMSGWFTDEILSSEERALVDGILSSIGMSLRVDSEEQLDQLSAISGSGPAFISLFLESMVDAAVQIGIPRAIGETLVLQTTKGTVLYAEKSGKHLAELRNEVTSPGGTTAEGLFSMEESCVRSGIQKGILNCYLKNLVLRDEAKKKSKLSE